MSSVGGCRAGRLVGGRTGEDDRDQHAHQPRRSVARPVSTSHRATARRRRETSAPNAEPSEAVAARARPGGRCDTRSAGSAMSGARREAVIGLDVGTTRVKAVAVRLDVDEQLVVVRDQPTRTDRSGPGRGRSRRACSPPPATPCGSAWPACTASTWWRDRGRRSHARAGGRRRVAAAGHPAADLRRRPGRGRGGRAGRIPGGGRAPPGDGRPGPSHGPAGEAGVDRSPPPAGRPPRCGRGSASGSGSRCGSRARR